MQQSDSLILRNVSKHSVEPDGSYVLEIPYSGDGELVMDILKYGPDVEVLEPKALRQVITDRLNMAAERYRK